VHDIAFTAVSTSVHIEPRGGPAWAGQSLNVLRVVTLPHQHTYLDRALPPDVTRVDGGRRNLGFAPDPLWEPRALAAQAGDIDVVHVHFGFDHVDPADLLRWTAAVHAAGLPLVVTVHDLRNPHHPSPERHDAQLRALLPAADAVLTLTDQAATELATRFHTHAAVVPHAAIFDGPADVPTEAGLVGLHLKSLRTNLVGLPAVVDAVRRGADAAGGRVEVRAHEEVAERVRPLAPVLLHARLDDEGLRRMLTRLSVLVLPQQFGTHSGLLEACRDVGTTVVAPSGGCYLDQWPEAFGYQHDEVRGLSAPSLTAAVAAAVAAAPAVPVDRDLRTAQAHHSHVVHTETYRRVLAA
jgi:hypothetical protein